MAKGVPQNDESKKENIPPNQSNPVPVNAPCFKKKFKRRLRVPLADITHLFNDSAVQISSSQQSVYVLSMSVSRKRKAFGEIGSSQGSSCDSNALRMGFR
ncbi:hypothetical protein SLE2022_274540 [Rubroshorea leprosula]